MRLKVVFIGCVKFSLTMLEKLRSNDEFEISGIVSKSRSDFNSDFLSLLSWAERFNIPSFDFSSKTDPEKYLAWIRACQPDVIFCLGWSHLLQPAFLSIPRLGVVGYHPAALPQNRGRHPIIWALALGLEETASTFFLMDGGADSGDILSQVPVRIGQRDTAKELYQNLEIVAQSQFGKILDDCARLRCLNGTRQDDLCATSWRKRTQADGLIDWRMSARNIHNLVRALTRPYIGAEFLLDGRTVKVWRTEISDTGLDRDEPGKILKTEGGILTVKCGEKSIRLLDIENCVIEEGRCYL